MPADTANGHTIVPSITDQVGPHADYYGLWAGHVATPPEQHRPSRGRLRRWSYFAAGGADDEHGDWMLGAAIVTVGPLATAFCFGHVGGEHLSWDGRGVTGRRATVGEMPGIASSFGQTVSISVEDGLSLTTDDGWSAVLSMTTGDTPAICATRTPAGGWNVTQKVAGDQVAATVTTPGGRRLEAAPGRAWLDWTAGRQDRHTTWTWGAGAGDAGSHRVGWNVSTGMNADTGEDLLWIDGVPHELGGVRLQPDGQPTGPWSLDAEGLSISLAPAGARSATENFLIAGSTYVQPYGVWSGSFAANNGESLDLTGHGVAEDHQVTW